MKSALTAIAVAGVCATSAAFANQPGAWDPALDYVILINNGQEFVLNNDPNNPDNEPQWVEFEIFVPANPNQVVGFSFAGNAFEITPTPTWASDTRLTVTAPNGFTFSLGGFPAPGNPNEHWDFQGPISTYDGTYIHGFGSPFGNGKPHFLPMPIDKGGFWTFRFEQTFGRVRWKGVIINLHKLPAPGTIALLGIAGLIAGRRRRYA